MKKWTFVFFTLTMLINYSKADTIGVKVTYKLTKTLAYSQLTLNLTINDTTSDENNSLSFFFKQDNVPQKQNFNQDEIKSQLIGNILKKDQIRIFVEHPNYIESIFDLITTQRKKEMAINIYDENNYQNAIQINSTTNSSTINNKKMASRTAIDIIIPIIVKSPNKLLLIDEFCFKFESKIYKTNKLVVELTK